MSSKSFCRIEGLDLVTAAIEELPSAFHRGVLLSALKRGAAPMVEDARARAPRGVDPRKRGSKKQRRSGESRQIGHGADTIQARPLRKDRLRPYVTTIAITPSSKHWYMKFAEFGTSRQPATPFLRPAFDAHYNEAIAIIAEEMGRWSERAARRLLLAARSGRLSARARDALSSATVGER